MRQPFCMNLTFSVLLYNVSYVHPVISANFPLSVESMVACDVIEMKCAWRLSQRQDDDIAQPTTWVSEAKKR